MVVDTNVVSDFFDDIAIGKFFGFNVTEMRVLIMEMQIKEEEIRERS